MGMLRDDAWQNVQANAIAQMLPIEVGWVLNERHPTLLRIARQHRAIDVQERPNDLGFGIEAGNAPRSGVAENPHEDGFDLVVERVGGHDAGSPLRCHLLEELPATATAFDFPRPNRRCTSTDTEKPAAQRLACNERGRAS